MKKHKAASGTGGPAGFSTQASLYGGEQPLRKPNSLVNSDKERFGKPTVNNNRKRGVKEVQSAQGTTPANNMSGISDNMAKVSTNKYRNGPSHLVQNQVSRSAINNPLHLKNKTMSNISIIDRISERQNRMEEKYFNHNIKQKRKSTNH